MADSVQNLLSPFFPWLVDHGIRVVLILIAAFCVRGILNTSIERIIRKLVVADRFLSHEAEKKREDTLIRIFSGALEVVIWILVSLLVLSELGIQIAPLLAAAGVAGLALGFGGQYLIRDLIAGLFIILENQYRLGDVVCLDGTCGLVEDITLRMTILRDLDGTVHHIPNGEIKKASNLSKSFARVNLNIGIAYNSDLEKVIEVVNRVGRELAQDPPWKEHIITPPLFLRVDNFGDSAIVIKILGETQPLKQWEVSGELRKRLKLAFDKAGIEIPFPQRVIHSVLRKEVLI